jgi:hypothetical protein
MMIGVMANSALRPEASEERAAPSGCTRAVVCPQCDAQLTWHASPTPQIDACGLESFRLQCTQCGASLAGVIDPYDDAVLLCALPS